MMREEETGLLRRTEGGSEITTPSLLGLDARIVVLENEWKFVDASFFQDGEMQEEIATPLIPKDDSKPQNDEGFEFMSLIHTPKDVANLLIIEAQAHCHIAGGTNPILIMGLFKNSDVDALAVGTTERPTATGVTPVSLAYSMVAGTVSAIEFKLRIGADATLNITFNGRLGARLFGGVGSISYIKILEYTLAS